MATNKSGVWNDSNYTSSVSATNYSPPPKTTGSGYLVGWLNKFIIEREQEVESSGDKQVGVWNDSNYSTPHSRHCSTSSVSATNYSPPPKTTGSADLDKFFQRAILPSLTR